MIEESDPRGYNMGSFLLRDTAIDTGLTTWSSADWIGVFHNMRYNLSFLDGQCSTVQVYDPLSEAASGVRGIHIPPTNKDLQTLAGMMLTDDE